MLILIRAILKRLARILDVVAEPRHGVARAQERCDAQDYEQGEGRQCDSFVHSICLYLSRFGTRREQCRASAFFFTRPGFEYSSGKPGCGALTIALNGKPSLAAPPCATGV